jgi:predicted transcriptional regulator
MALAVKGEYEKVKRLRDKAEKEGLDIIYFSNNSDFIKQIDLAFLKTDKKQGEEIIELSTKNKIGIKTAEILHIIKRFGEIRPYEIARESASKCNSVAYHLKILQEKGLIEKDEKGKKETYYRLVE